VLSSLKKWLVPSEPRTPLMEQGMLPLWVCPDGLGSLLSSEVRPVMGNTRILPV